MIDFIQGITFWQWYWIDVTWKTTFFGFMVWQEGKVTAKEVFAYIAMTFIPLINLIVTILAAMALVQAVAESDEDLILWQRKGKREKNVD